MSQFQHKYSAPYSPDLVWRAINKPLLPQVTKLVFPHVGIEYQNLSTDNEVQRGTRMILRPEKNLARASMFKAFLPKDVVMSVEDFDPHSRTRVDRLIESQKAEGFIERQVDEDDDQAILVVRAELAIHGLGSMIEDAAIHYGIHEPSQRTIDHLPALVR